MPSLKATACGYLAGAQANTMGSLDSDSFAALEALLASIPQVRLLCPELHLIDNNVQLNAPAGIDIQSSRQVSAPFA